MLPGQRRCLLLVPLVPLREAMAERASSGAGTRLLEVAGGTGRFATFIKVHVLPLSSYEI